MVAYFIARQDYCALYVLCAFAWYITACTLASVFFAPCVDWVFVVIMIAFCLLLMSISQPPDGGYIIH